MKVIKIIMVSMKKNVLFTLHLLWAQMSKFSKFSFRNWGNGQKYKKKKFKTLNKKLSLIFKQTYILVSVPYYRVESNEATSFTFCSTRRTNSDNPLRKYLVRNILWASLIHMYAKRYVRMRKYQWVYNENKYLFISIYNSGSHLEISYHLYNGYQNSEVFTFSKRFKLTVNLLTLLIQLFFRRWRLLSWMFLYLKNKNQYKQSF